MLTFTGAIKRARERIFLHFHVKNCYGSPNVSKVKREHLCHRGTNMK